ncbi:MAG: Nif3-like dinuclear metal center hexameric protein [Thermoguttaceae bacterium]|nr:Nif3-like dinuclear metal center hexameric protein [Thermoguttaceae bacterium]
MQLQSLIEYLEQICPLELAEDWDNVGLLLGDRQKPIKKVLACLTIDRAVAEEAVELGVDCVVSHHPFPFKSAKRWTTDTTDGELLLKLAGSKIAVYSPHTAHDSALFGVNRQLAEGLGLRDVRSLYPGKLPATKEALDGLDPSDVQNVAKELEKRGKKSDESAPLIGTGRIGALPKPKKFSELVEQIKDMLQIESLQIVGDADKQVKTVAIGCGASDDFIAQAAKEKADVMLLGEARFHACLEARSKNLALVLAGHYATERFSMCILADRIGRKFPELIVQASGKESDPIRVA